MHSDTVPLYDERRASHYRAVWRNILDNNAICSDDHPIADATFPQDLGSGTDGHIMADDRTVLRIRITDSDALIDPAVSADLPRGDNGTKTVLNKDSPLDIVQVKLQRGERRSEHLENMKQDHMFLRADSCQNNAPKLREKKHQITEYEKTAILRMAENGTPSFAVGSGVWIVSYQEIDGRKSPDVQQDKYVLK